jgi:hypothetical protein
METNNVTIITKFKLYHLIYKKDDTILYIIKFNAFGEGTDNVTPSFFFFSFVFLFFFQGLSLTVTLNKFFFDI